MSSTSARRYGAGSDHAATVLSRAIDWLGSRTVSTPRWTPRWRTARGLAAAGMTALDLVALVVARRAQRADRSISSSVVVRRPRVDVYAFWRELANLPLVMDHLVSVREADPQWSHWVARLPTGTIAWDVRLTNDLPGERIVWRSVTGSVIELRGQVVFADAPGGATEVCVKLKLGATTNRQSRALSRLFSAAQLAGDLRRLNGVLEDRAEIHGGRSAAGARARRSSSGFHSTHAHR